MQLIATFVQLHLSIIVITLAIAELLVLVILIWMMFKMRRNSLATRTFLSGKDGKDLEDLIESQVQEIKALDDDIQALYSISNKLHKLANRSVHKVGLVRFNPFKDIGGDQSFSIALLDGKNTGLVLSSLHTKEGTRVYAKPVIDGKADKYPFTEEEKRAIVLASPVKGSKM